MGEHSLEALPAVHQRPRHQATEKTRNANGVPAATLNPSPCLSACTRQGCDPVFVRGLEHHPLKPTLLHAKVNEQPHLDPRRF